MHNPQQIRTSINRNGIVMFWLSGSEGGKPEFLVMFKANDRCTTHRSRALRIRNYKEASATFDEICDTTEV